MAFIYTDDERKYIKNISFTIVPYKSKYLGLNLIKEVKDLCKENYKTLLQKIKEDARK